MVMVHYCFSFSPCSSKVIRLAVEIASIHYEFFYNYCNIDNHALLFFFSKLLIFVQKIQIIITKKIFIITQESNKNQPIKQSRNYMKQKKYLNQIDVYRYVKLYICIYISYMGTCMYVHIVYMYVAL